MKRKQWGAQGAAERGDFHFWSLLRRVVTRSRAAARPIPDRSGKKPSADSAGDACWTASLNRGRDLPPWRLSILTDSRSPFAMRLEPYRDRTDGPRRDV